MKTLIMIVVYATSVAAQTVITKWNILSGHSNQIADMAFSPDGKYLASVGYYHEGRIWDVEKKALHKTIDHEEQFYVSSAAFSPDGKFLVTGTKGRKLITEREGMMFLWSVETGTLIKKIEVGSGEINDVAYSPDGQYVACANKEKTISIFSTAGKLLKTLTGHDRSVLAIEFSPDGKKLLSVQEFGGMALWDVATGENLAMWTNKRDRPSSVGFTRDGKIMYCLQTGSGVDCWKVDTGEPMTPKVFSDPKKFRPASASPDLEFFMAKRFHYLSVFSLASSDTLFKINDYPKAYESQHTFSPDGRWFAASDRNGSIILWSLGVPASRDVRRSASAEASFESFAGGSVATIVKAEKVEIQTDVWKRLSGHTDQVRGIGFISGGHLLASAGFDKSGRIWNVDMGQVVRNLTGHTAPIQHLATSLDGKWILSGGGDQTIRIWDAASGQPIRTLASDQGYSVFSIAVSQDKRYVAAGTQYKKIIVWDAKTGQKIKTFEGSDRPIYAVAFSKDGSFLFGVTGLQIKRWAITTGEEVVLRGNSFESGHKHYVNTLAASPDGRWLASGGNDNRVVLWDANSLQEIREMKGHSGEIHCLTFSNNGGLLASGGADKAVKLWSTADGKMLRTFSGNNHEVRCVTFSSDGRFLAASDEGGEIVVWQIPDNLLSGGKISADNTPPVITVIEPAVKRGMRQAVPAKDIVVRGTATDESGILEVTVNGVEARVTEKGEFAASVKLAIGDNLITVRAVDTKSNAAQETFTVLRETETKSATAVKSIARKDYALVIATDDYDSWSDLVNPINDSRTLEKELTEHYGFQVERVENPNLSGIMAKLREYAQKPYADKDQLFIFIAGHGQFDNVFKEGYLVAKDSKRDDELRTSYMSHSNLRTIVNNIPCKHIFLVMDVCFGGTFDPLIASRGDEYSDMSKDEFIERKLKQTTRKYMTSGGKEYVPDGVPGRHSPFARRLLEALRSYGGADGILTLAELQTFVEKTSPQPQSGKFGNDEAGSDFLFIVR